MSALLTYRSRNSFESRFGRKAAEMKSINRPHSPREANRLIHNDGHYPTSPPTSEEENVKNATINNPSMPTPFVFSAQSYLRYQGSKFINRFDANCYIALTRKMDSHDLSRGRGDYFDILASIDQPALVIGIESDGLFTISEQYELAEGMADTEMIVIDSPDGHDGFLLEFDQINRHLLNFIKRVVPEIYSSSTITDEELEQSEVVKATKTSLFGEAEVDITQW